MTPMLKQRDLTSWDRLIAEAIHEPNPALSNQKVTDAHYLLSQALRQVVGADGGANFHSWAVWGSRKAGETIREEGSTSCSAPMVWIAAAIGSPRHERATGLGWNSA